MAKDPIITNQKFTAQPIQGRGAVSNTPNRFESTQLEPLEFEDNPVEDAIEGLSTWAPRRPRTLFFKDKSRSIIAENDSPDVGFRFGVNPYRGCEHGCIYCYARPTHEFLGFSAGIDFETRIIVKEDAPELLRKKLMSRSWEPATIAMSGNTDCFQPIERKMQITRRCLEVLREFRNPVITISKNHLVTRDIDILGEMASMNAAASWVSVTSLDEKLCAILEPRTSRPHYRIKAIEELSKAGVPVGVMLAPVIPGLNDHEIPNILAEAARAGARFAGFTPVRLPLSVEPLFLQWLEVHAPDRKDRVLNLLRSMRGGKLNDPSFNSRMRGEGQYAEQIRALFKLTCRKHGLNRTKMELSTDSFQRPGTQLGLF